MVEVTGVPAQLDVYLVPAGANRYELFCEPASDEGEPSAPASTLWGRLVASFRSAVAEGEAEQAGLGTADAPPERSRLRRAITRKIAAVVAEQRLLWRIRHQTAARLMHPDDVTGDDALAIGRAQIGADLAKHRNWCLIDALLTAITGPAFFFVPGPNVVSWYFAFRAVGHYFAYRGARQAREVVKWESHPTSLLTDLRAALNLECEPRSERVATIAKALGLERLPMFLARVADRPVS